MPNEPPENPPETLTFTTTTEDKNFLDKLIGKYTPKDQGRSGVIRFAIITLRKYDTTNTEKTNNKHLTTKEKRYLRLIEAIEDYPHQNFTEERLNDIIIKEVGGKDKMDPRTIKQYKDMVIERMDILPIMGHKSVYKKG